MSEKPRGDELPKPKDYPSAVIERILNEIQSRRNKVEQQRVDANEKWRRLMRVAYSCMRGRKVVNEKTHEVTLLPPPLLRPECHKYVEDVLEGFSHIDEEILDLEVHVAKLTRESGERFGEMETPIIQPAVAGQQQPVQVLVQSPTQPTRQETTGRHPFWEYILQRQQRRTPQSVLGYMEMSESLVSDLLQRSRLWNMFTDYLHAAYNWVSAPGFAGREDVYWRQSLGAVVLLNKIEQQVIPAMNAAISRKLRELDAQTTGLARKLLEQSYPTGHGGLPSTPFERGPHPAG